ncbi:MAG TPA: response regulator transcription factor [Opitutaceae bacterium]|nr:response regulator transcription factor [Opitutaceae bacterium]
MKTTVALIEDNAGICEELKLVFAEAPDVTCVSVSRNLQTALRVVPPLAPNVVIMDIQLPDGSGVDGAARLKRLLPETQIVMYTITQDADQIYRALEAGASGYLLKSASPEELIRSIREVRQGGVPMTPEVARKVIQSFRRPAASRSAVEALTKREEEVLELLAQGLASGEIAQALRIGIETVNTHLKHIYGKLHVRSRTEAVIKYRG